MTDNQIESIDHGTTEVSAEALIGESLIEEVSIDGMCGVY
ncbi:mycofactocin precursor MftA [Nocardia sp. NBC_00565]|nr:mycofactocin precursor MftA [Nocardia sp. NBC_00565]WUC05722.1 mycofactocin precursor MftA [Nocardia sp. NBC_00565]